MRRVPKNYAYAGAFIAMLLQGVIDLQERGATREAADAIYQRIIAGAASGDANDLLYAYEMVMDYDPSKELERIKARVLAINFADDEVNPAGAPGDGTGHEANRAIEIRHHTREQRDAGTLHSSAGLGLEVPPG